MGTMDFMLQRVGMILKIEFDLIEVRLLDLVGEESILYSIE